ncbi:MAG: CBS domain-containing protein [Elusimicrobia bacterium]|nr:CBS domain-containing protein [Elusimicrobiota bacterium]
MRARDVMCRRVPAVHPETRADELARLFSERGVRGAPVVGPEGDLIGVVSQTDLIRGRRAGSAAAAMMTPWVVSFEEDTDVEVLARQMLVKRIHQLVITREGRMRGIVTTMDLLRAFVGRVGMLRADRRGGSLRPGGAMLAKDIMRRNVVTVGRWLTLSELAKVFEEKCISGAPVVDEAGSILGVVSQTDLVRTRREASPGVPAYHREFDDTIRAGGLHIEEFDQTRVEEIMTPGAISLDEATPVEKVAKVMINSRIHRVLITRADRLVGIVTTMDFLRALVVLAKRTPTKRPRARAGA